MNKYTDTIIARVTNDQKRYVEQEFETISEGIRTLIDDDKLIEPNLAKDIYNV